MLDVDDTDDIDDINDVNDIRFGTNPYKASPQNRVSGTLFTCGGFLLWVV